MTWFKILCRPSNCSAVSIKCFDQLKSPSCVRLGDLVAVTKKHPLRLTAAVRLGQQNMVRVKRRGAAVSASSTDHVRAACAWEGKDEEEVGRCQETGVIHVKVDPKYFRPTEVHSTYFLFSKANLNMNVACFRCMYQITGHCVGDHTLVQLTASGSQCVQLQTMQTASVRVMLAASCLSVLNGCSYSGTLNSFIQRQWRLLDRLIFH
ncbi:hypothetical protein PAMP_023964 [Pampus punctatissimus]